MRTLPLPWSMEKVGPPLEKVMKLLSPELAKLRNFTSRYIRYSFPRAGRVSRWLASLMLRSKHISSDVNNVIFNKMLDYLYSGIVVLRYS